MDSGADTKSVSELRERVLTKATEDEAFRARLLSDPKAAVEEELGVQIPAEFTIEVHEEAAGTGHLVLPPLSKLDEPELRQAQGGEEKITFWDDAPARWDL